jgi:hypothetical protein
MSSLSSMRSDGLAFRGLATGCPLDRKLPLLLQVQLLYFLLVLDQPPAENDDRMAKTGWLVRRCRIYPSFPALINTPVQQNTWFAFGQGWELIMCLVSFFFLRIRSVSCGGFVCCETLYGCWRAITQTRVLSSAQSCILIQIQTNNTRYINAQPLRIKCAASSI